MLKQWLLHLEGTELYNGESFVLKVVFSPSYPMEAPEFTFLPPAPIHPHIYSNGTRFHTPFYCTDANRTPDTPSRAVPYLPLTAMLQSSAC